MDERLQAWTDDGGDRRATGLFRTAFEGEPDGVWAAPGRVNVIGEHLDYNAGPCLPIALPHRTYVAMRRRPDDEIRLVSAMDPAAVWRGSIDSLGPGEVTGWAAYAAGVAWSLGEQGCPTGGFDAAVASCVPVGAGLSSSAALECAVALGLSDCFALGLAAEDAGRRRLVAAAVRAENEVAGAPTGGMDQAASLRTREGHALLLDSRDQSIRQVPFDLANEGLRLLVMDTQVAHALVDGQYAARRAACERAASLLGVPSLREVTDLDDALGRLPAQLRARVRHVVSEIARVGDFVALLEQGRLRDTGGLLDASHASLRDDYEVSCPELDLAVAAASSAGALGARMTGGGFGGSAVALVEAGAVGPVTSAVAAAFAARGWTAPRCFEATAGAPGGRVR